MSERDDVQREIEENERRARDEQDVGLEEDVVEGQGGDGTVLDDLDDGLFGDDDGRNRDDQRRRNDPLA